MKKMSKKLGLLLAALLLVFSVPVFADNHVTDDIVDIAVGNADFSILVSALQKAELVETLQGD